MYTLYKKYLLLGVLASALHSCSGPAVKVVQDDATAPGTPVTLTKVSTDSLIDYIYLNATATFQQKSYVKANVNGYVESAQAVLGKYISKGQTLFTLKTKEAQSIGNSINKLNPEFKFSGTNYIKSTSSGYITQLNHQVGDYVQDGEQLAAISDENSFAFILNLPYELKKYLTRNGTVDMILPDDTRLKGTVSAFMPTVDPATQTQNVIIKIPKGNMPPENLIAKVRIMKTNKANGHSVPKAAILTNDIQTVYWVMKLIDSNTAVKVPVKTGIETQDRVEILEPEFSTADKIILTGNYGLPDTAKVRIIQ